MPMRRAVLMTRHAISPRLAIRILSNITWSSSLALRQDCGGEHASGKRVLDGAGRNPGQSRCKSDFECFRRKEDQEAGGQGLFKANQCREPRRSKNHDDGIARQKNTKSRGYRAHCPTL